MIVYTPLRRKVSPFRSISPMTYCGDLTQPMRIVDSSAMNGARRKVDHGQNNDRLFAVSMENFHTVCHDGFQHRNAGGQRRKNRRKEEQIAHKSARFFLYEATIVW